MSRSRRLVVIFVGDSVSSNVALRELGVVAVQMLQVRRNIGQQSVVLKTLVEIAHPLVENVERLLLFQLANCPPGSLTGLLRVIVVYRFHYIII